MLEQSFSGDITPYEFFRPQVDDRLMGAISTHNYLLSAGVEATSRVYRAIEAQTPILRDISTSIKGNTEAVMRTGALLIEQNSRLGNIARGIAQGNAIHREGNNIMLGIASMIARANGIDISDVLPQYFPKPPIPKPPTIPPRIKAGKSRIELSILTLDAYQSLFGKERILEDKKRYMRLSDQQLAALTPAGIADGMILDAYKAGRLASSDFETAIADYDTQLNLIDRVFTQIAIDSKAQSLLSEVGRNIWKGSDVAVLPILVDINYGEIPEKDRKVVVGYKLVTPPRYSPEDQSSLSVSIYYPVSLEYFPSSGSITTDINEGVLVLDADIKGNFPFAARLRQLNWEEWTTTRRGTKERFLKLRYSAFTQEAEKERWLLGANDDQFQANTSTNGIICGQVATSPARVPAVIRETQSYRILTGRLPQGLQVTNDANLSKDRQRASELRPGVQEREQRRLMIMDLLRKQMRRCEPNYDIDVTKDDHSIWDYLIGVPGRIEAERDRRQKYYKLQTDYDSLEKNGRLPDETYEQYKKSRIAYEEFARLDKSFQDFQARQDQFNSERKLLPQSSGKPLAKPNEQASTTRFSDTLPEPISKLLLKASSINREELVAGTNLQQVVSRYGSKAETIQFKRADNSFVQLYHLVDGQYSSPSYKGRVIVLENGELDYYLRIGNHQSLLGFPVESTKIISKGHRVTKFEGGSLVYKEGEGFILSHFH